MIVGVWRLRNLEDNVHVRKKGLSLHIGEILQSVESDLVQTGTQFAGDPFAGCI